MSVAWIRNASLLLPKNLSLTLVKVGVPPLKELLFLSSALNLMNFLQCMHPLTALSFMLHSEDDMLKAIM